jgi:2-iminoacetate synthase
MLTLAEYIEDYSSEATKKAGYELIERELGYIKDEKKREDVSAKLDLIRNGKRDLLY